MKKPNNFWNYKKLLKFFKSLRRFSFGYDELYEIENMSKKEEIDFLKGYDLPEKVEEGIDTIISNLTNEELFGIINEINLYEMVKAKIKEQICNDLSKSFY